MAHRIRIVLVVVLFVAGLPLACRLPSPVCPTDSLQAPVLGSPPDNATINTVRPSLSWSYPADCHPEGYRIDLSVTADFSDTSLSGGTGNPSTTWGPGEELTDCTQYYWRVAPINGTTLGPFSPSRTFRVDVSGTCSAAAGGASISGRVWHDLCAAPDGPVPTPVPEGCVYADGLWANGLMEEGEPGLEGVVVQLGSGDCPATGVASSTTTGPDGEYGFTGLVVGEYCVSIDALESPNDSLLIPGGWTWPPALTTGLAWDAVTLSGGEQVSDVNFGWDYQFLPAPEGLPATVMPTITPSPTPALGRIGGRIWNDICHFSGGVAGEPLVLGPDCVGDPAGVWGANGQVDPGEPPMAGVTFRLGAGDCPAPTYATASSNSSGYFMFTNLPAGTYCVMLNPLTDGNDVLLIPGGPSNFPTVNGELQIEIDLGPGEDALWIAIGWEWQHLG